MSACNDAINANIATAQAFKTWKDAKQSSLDSRTVATDLPNLQANIFDTANCLNEKISGLSTLSTADSNTQLQIDNLQKKIDDEIKNKEISQHRLDSLKNKETSYYESWFPRPMKQEALFGLFGTALLLLLASASIFLGMSGVEFQILAPNWVFPGIDFSMFTSRMPILLAGLGVGLILGVVGHSLKWF